MSYVLVLFVALGQTGGGMSAEFPSAEACLKAAEAVRGEFYRPFIVAVCIHKETGLKIE